MWGEGDSTNGVGLADKAKDGDQFVFVSDSTIPVKPFKHVWQTLCGDVNQKM